MKQFDGIVEVLRFGVSPRHGEERNNFVASGVTAACELLHNVIEKVKILDKREVDHTTAQTRCEYCLEPLCSARHAHTTLRSRSNHITVLDLFKNRKDGNFLLRSAEHSSSGCPPLSFRRLQPGRNQCYSFSTSRHSFYIFSENHIEKGVI